MNKRLHENKSETSNGVERARAILIDRWDRSVDFIFAKFGDDVAWYGWSVDSR